MKAPAYLIDAFTNIRFAGNQAAVCLIPNNLPDNRYQTIAAEFNLSETAYPVPKDPKEDFKTAQHFSLRWFTPKVEVALCGHATLATSHVLLNEIENVNKELFFHTLSGVLSVKKGTNGAVEMDFPQYQITSVKAKGIDTHFHGIFPEFVSPVDLLELIRSVVPDSINVIGVAYAAECRKLIVVIDPETTNLEFGSLEKNTKGLLDNHPDASFVKGMIVTFKPTNPDTQGFVDSQGVPYNYVCRYFAPWVGIDEDPATGSAQCALGPFWGKVLGLNNLYAFQAFPNRGAQFHVELKKDGRCGLVGNSVTVLSGEISLDSNFY